MAYVESLSDKSMVDSLMQRLHALEGLVSELRANLMEAERLTHANLEMAGVIHDLNNSLTAVIGHARAVARPGSSESPQSDASDRCVQAAIKCQQLLRSLNDHVGRTSEHVDASTTACCVNQAMVAAMRMVVRAESEHTQIYTVGLSTLYVSISEASLVRVLQNLLLNAFEATGPAGQVWVRWRTVDHDVEIVVEDNGPGIPASCRGGLFRAKARADGRGLGLWVCRDLVEEVGGEIAVESREGGGARFRIRLPASDPP